MAIADDFRIYPFSKVIRHDSGTTVYSVTAFYSFLMDFFDEPTYQSYEAPMKFNTPTSFSMINGWFLDDGDFSTILQFLTGASIDSIDYTTVDDPVYMMDVDAESTAFVNADKDEEILDDATGVGPLLAFKANYPTATTARFWVRDTRVSPATIASSSNITMTAPGAADYNANTLGPSVNGDEVYSNVFTLASFPGSPDPQVYIYQDHPVSGNTRVRFVEWSGLSNWNRDPNGIDILIPIQLGGTEIDGGNISTFVRQTGDSYTFVESDLTGGARTPLATETLSDAVNVTEGETFLLYDSGSVGGFSVGDVIANQSTAANATPPTWYAEVVAVQEFTINTTGVLALRAYKGTIADNDAIFVGTVDEGTAQGVPGGTFFTWDAGTDPIGTDTSTGNGRPFTGSVSGATRLLRGFELFSGSAGAAVLNAAPDSLFATEDGHNLNTPALHDALYIDPVDNDIWSASSGGGGTMSVTADALYAAPFLNNTLVSDFTDVTIAHVNGTVVVDTLSGTWEVGERVTWTGGGPAIYVAGSTTSITLANIENETALNTDPLTLTGQASGATYATNGTGGLTDANTSTFAFTQQSANTFSVVVEGGFIYNAARSLNDIYKYWQYYVRDGQALGDRTIWSSDNTAILPLAADEYIKAKSSYTATKPAPFGTLAGTLLFGAQGVWVQGTASVDDLRLTDDGGTARQGTPSVLVQITNTRVDDVVSCFLEDGSTGLPDKTQFTSNGITAVSASTFQVSITIPVDTPSTGTVFIVDDSFGQADKEHRYKYSSFSADTFTLKAEVTGTADGATTGTTLFDTGIFTAAAVARGDIIRNTTDPSIGYILTRVGNNEVTTTQMRDSAGVVVPWAVSDSFEVNSIVNATTSSDTAFVPYLDEIEDVGTEGSPGTVSDTLLFLSNRAVVIRVRNNLAATEIVPFITTSDILSGGMTVSVIRTEDTVTT